MKLYYGVSDDIDNWMKLVNQIRYNFPGLETQEEFDEHKATVLKFMSKQQAICVKVSGEIAGIMLFSRSHNMICFLGVSADYRRRGIASILMNEALNNLDRSKKISVCTFRVDDEKGLAPRALYEKYGFIEGALVEVFGYPNQEYVLYLVGSECGERQKSINRIIQEISSILSGNEISIYLYGSSVLDDFRFGWSVIDILVLTKNQISEEQAKKLVKLRQIMLESEPDNEYYRSFEGSMLTLNAFISKSSDRVVYWGTSGERIADSYTFNSFDMLELIENSVLLHGCDVRIQLRAPGFSDLCDDVKYHYESIRKYVQKTERSLYSFGWLLDISRCLYTLHTGKIIAKTAAAEWALENNLCPVPDVLKMALKVRKAPIEYKNDKQILDYAESLAVPIQNYADVLEDELHRIRSAYQRKHNRC